MPARPLDVVKGRLERGLVEIVGFERSKKAHLETLDGADPEPGKQKVPGLEAVVDRADRRLERPGDSRDRSGVRTTLRHQPHGSVHYLVLAELGRPRHAHLPRGQLPIGPWS